MRIFLWRPCFDRLGESLNRAKLRVLSLSFLVPQCARRPRDREKETEMDEAVQKLSFGRLTLLSFLLSLH